MSPKLAERNLAYLAGLLDGEGHFSLTKRKRSGGRWIGYVAQIVLHMGTAEPLQTVAGWLGCPVTTYQAKRTYGTVKMWRLRLPNRQFPKAETLWLLRRLLPHLILKRRQAELLLGFEDVRQIHTPNRVHVGAGRFTPIPPEGVNAIEDIRAELLGLYSSKRNPRCT